MKIWQVSVSRRRCAPRVLTLALPALLLSATAGSWPSTAAAEEENKILTATKSALYGGAAGLLLGGVAALVVNRDDRDNAMRWGVVVGTFSGFAYGLYDVTRHQNGLSLLPLRESQAPDLAELPGFSFGRTGSERNMLGTIRPSPKSRSLGRAMYSALAEPGRGPITRSCTFEGPDCGRTTP